jgi:hypothetical protein
MPADDAPKPDPPCEKCGAATTSVTFIRRFAEQPAYHIFECATCKALTWIAEKIGE